jgi:hypothetical protein
VIAIAERGGDRVDIRHPKRPQEIDRARPDHGVDRTSLDRQGLDERFGRFEELDEFPETVCSGGAHRGIRVPECGGDGGGESLRRVLGQHVDRGPPHGCVVVVQIWLDVAGMVCGESE